MNFFRKKWLALLLAAILSFGGMGAGYAYTSETDTYEELFSYVYGLYLDDLTNDDVVAVGAALLAIYDHEAELKTALLGADDYGYLDDYGFDNAAYTALFDWLRTNAVEIKDFLDAVVEDSSPNATLYGSVLQGWASEVWTLLPSEFKARVNEFADTPAERLQLIQLFIQNVVLTSDLGTATENASGTFTLELDSALMNWAAYQDLIDDPVLDLSNPAVFSDATKAAADAVFGVLESEFATYQTIINVLIKFDLLAVDEYTAPIGGGGGGGGGVMPPEEEPAPAPESPKDNPNPDSTYTSLAMREALQLITSAVITETQADPVLADLKEEVLDGDQDILETLQVVKRAADLVEKLLDNPLLTDEEAAAYVNQILTQFIAPALEKDAAGGTYHELETQATELVEMLLARVGEISTTDMITEVMVRGAEEAQNDALLVLANALSDIFSAAEIAALSQNISVEIDGTLVKVDPAAVTYMKQNDIGLVVMTGSIQMTIPAALMDTLRPNLTLAVELEPKGAAASGLGEQIKGGAKGILGGAYELSVYLMDAQNNVVEVLSNIEPIISLPLGNFRTNLHAVGAYFYNETTGEWEYVRSHVAGGRVVFEAPHLSTYGVLQKNIMFTDMISHWAKLVVEELSVKGVVSGRSTTEFEPNGTITRAEFATLLVQALELKGDIKVTFNDVFASDWYYQYVNVAALHGLVSGVGAGKFDPNANITRQDMAIMIMKAYELQLGTRVNAVPVEIKDLPMVSAYAKDRVLAARFNKLIGGYPDGTFKPLANATRAEAAQMVKNLLGK